MAEQIAAAIREAIAERKLPPGCRLVEMKIAREMGTSRGPLREALFQLEREGLVVRKPNRGTFVVSLTEELIRQIASLRGVLEGFAATLALKRLTEEDFHQLERILMEMSAMARAGDFPAMVERDYRFHEYIVRASGHPLLHDTWQGLAQKIRIYQTELNGMYPDMSAVVKGHVAILRAFRQNDAKRLSRIVADHMVKALKPHVTKFLRGRESGGPSESTASIDAVSSMLGNQQRKKRKAGSGDK
jgi:DNA-binding GntR family transcriptional regulator